MPHTIQLLHAPHWDTARFMFYLAIGNQPSALLAVVYTLMTQIPFCQLLTADEVRALTANRYFTSDSHDAFHWFTASVRALARSRKLPRLFG